MYKYLGLLIIFIFISVNLGCSITPDSSANNLRDMFVAVWAGERKGKREGIIKKWTQTRNEDGTYELRFNVFENGVPMDTSLEKGKWWLEGDLFYEIAPLRMSVPDIYKYEIINNDEIKFTRVSRDKSGDVKELSYTFIDKKVSSN